MTAKRALVTGGAGFVGHHLARKLLEEGCSVMVLDNFAVGKRENIAALMDHPDFQLSETDLRDEKAAAEAVAAFAPTVVFHLAAIHFIPYCSEHPTETIKVNVVGIQHLLEAVRNTPSVKRFVFASTADVYVPQDTPNLEDRTPTGSFNIYGISKLICEDLIRYYGAICPDVTFVCARLFNVYGPEETNPHVMPDILNYMAHSNTLPLGNVEPKRDYVYVTDVADAFIALSGDDVPATTANVATGREYSVKELVEMMGKLTGRDLVIVRDPSKFRLSERMHLIGDNGKISRLTRWSPKHTLAEGLAKLLEHRGLMGEQAEPVPVGALESEGVLND